MGLLVCAFAKASAQEIRFTVFKGGDPVGNIRAARSIAAKGTSYLITSSSELWMLWKQEVETIMSTEYAEGLLTSSRSTMRINGNMRDSSRMYSTAAGMWAYVHPDKVYPYHSSTQWTTSRMYFEEPVGQSTIMVESVLRDCPIRRTGPGTYELTLPNKDRNRYVYLGGKLMEVYADRLLINLVFRRAA